MKLMVVGDMSTFGEFALKYLQKFNPKAYPSSIEAIKNIPEFSPDVIIADAVMPGIHGLDFLTIATKISPHSQIITVSENPNENFKAEAGKIKAHFFRKPFGDDILTFLRSLNETFVGRETTKISPEEQSKTLDRFNVIGDYLTEYNERIIAGLKEVPITRFSEERYDYLADIIEKIDVACKVIGLNRKEIFEQTFRSGKSWRNWLLENKHQFLKDCEYFEVPYTPILIDYSRFIEYKGPTEVNSFEVRSSGDTCELLINGSPIKFSKARFFDEKEADIAYASAFYKSFKRQAMQRYSDFGKSFLQNRLEGNRRIQVREAALIDGKEVDCLDFKDGHWTLKFKDGTAKGPAEARHSIDWYSNGSFVFIWRRKVEVSIVNWNVEIKGEEGFLGNGDFFRQQCYKLDFCWTQAGRFQSEFEKEMLSGEESKGLLSRFLRKLIG